MVHVSNEEIVAAIQAGDHNRMGELWEQTERFIAWKARRALTTLEGNSTVEVDDLIQSGYFALVAAVRTYKPGKMVFVNWLSFYLQTVFAEVAGYRTEKMRNDPCRWATSLDMPMGEDGNTTISEIIQDAEATATMEAVEESLWREQLRKVETELISGLHKDQREVMH
jgi:DNA-directed RNA polymerase specialized sigma24 family protein